MENQPIRSENVQEILGYTPKWVFRWGITGVFIILIFFIFLTWLIKYPDIMVGSCNISTKKPTIELFTKSTGEIQNIYFEEHAILEKGQTIAQISNSMNPDCHNYMTETCKAFNKNFEASVKTYPFNDNTIIFGSLNHSYLEFKRAVLDYRLFLDNNSLAAKISFIKEQISNYQALRKIAQEQVTNSLVEFDHATEKYKSDKKLFDQNVISKFTFYESEKMYWSEKRNHEAHKKDMVQNRITITELKQQLLDLEAEVKTKSLEKVESVRGHLITINNYLVDWERSYEIKAPIAGKLSYLERLAVNTYVEAGMGLFAITPQNQAYIGIATIPSSGYGKVKRGQKVRIRLDNFPSTEFGYLTGEVTSLSALPQEKSYKIHFKLTNGFRSSFGMELQYTPEMSATAEIITEDLRLIDRIFIKFRNLINKK